jgi:CBS domain-containing protein
VTSALVIDEGVLVGIFTSVDALRLLADLRGSTFATDSRS